MFVSLTSPWLGLLSPVRRLRSPRPNDVNKTRGAIADAKGLPSFPTTSPLFSSISGVELFKTLFNPQPEGAGAYNLGSVHTSV